MMNNKLYFYLSKLKLLFMVVMLLSVQSVFAAQAPVDMLNKVSQQMIKALKKNHQQIKKHPELADQLARSILLPHFDAKVMARLALGRDHWQHATAQERKQFVNSFTSLLIRTYSSALVAYNNETIRFKPIRGELSGKRRVQVHSVIYQRGGPQIPVSYRLLLRDNEWKVYDISVDGVSMIQSFRSQFSGYITRGGMVSLLHAMDKHHKES